MVFQVDAFATGIPFKNAPSSSEFHSDVTVYNCVYIYTIWLFNIAMENHNF